MKLIRFIRLGGLALALGAAENLLAAPVLSAVAVGPQAPASITPGQTATYAITVSRNGSGDIDVDLSIESLPAGATGAFSPVPVRFNGPAPLQKNATLTISTDASITNGIYPFTVHATDRANSNRKTTHGTLAVGQGGGTVQSIVSCAMLPEVGFTITCAGDPNTQCLLQATTDLTSLSAWVTICTNTSDSNGLFSFIDTDAKIYPVRFYRTVRVP